MGVRVDFHTHILPAMDDGSKSTEQSVQMLMLEKQAGIDTVVLTPHFYAHSDRPERFLHRRQQSFEALKAAVEGTDTVQLKLGAEVYWFNGISDWEGLADLAIEGTDFVLIEMPFERWSERMLCELDGIYRKRGLVPIVAHIERYINVLNASRVLGRLKDMNVMIQANGEFFTHSRTRSLALKMLKNGDIDLIGSDCHNLADRAPDIDRAQEVIRARLGEEIFEQINRAEDRVLPCNAKQII